MEPASSWQLFNTSWTLHRLSPLHHKKDCEALLDNQYALNTYAARLRDQLTGDVLAGLQATASAADDDALSKTGALKECTWRSFSTSSPSGDASSASDRHASFPGILVTLEYENITYKAALLAESSSSSQRPSRAGSTFLPLLLTKCPNALRQTLISFLSANFDAYCAPLRLSSAFLCSGLEKFVDELRTGSDRTASDDILEEVIRELQLTLAFSAAIAPALKSLNVSIARSSLAGFIHDGANTSKRTLKQKLRCPLIPNLTSYLETHLAMQLDLDGSSPNQVAKQHVRLSKVTCAAFVLGGDGRMKLVVSATRSENQGQDERMGKDEAALRASEALLHAVIGKAVISDHQTAT
ncbi:CENP-A-nucleosome distal centromere subunit CENP-L [Penicillium malachiteum]|uniref:CENP-A-nucleosome distal centromere subunit CENP-L n=1 Tax=Penicillium malachiteum TaxID=1324776 RepID=UPI002548B512|nr:CENP-A-nucleosome distal centromere subunit CENP-L [Penicillium malachiteum]KAJ5735273.1 CENP-A-nucleosome distal centromere subunit CENP-L [Penicillium malachiteum]